MYDSSDSDNIIQPKKKKDTDDDGPVSKKVQKKNMKNINKSLATNRLLSQFQQKEQTKRLQKIKEKAIPKVNQDYAKKVEYLKSISPNHKQSTILEQLKKHNMDLNDAMQALMGIPEDEESTTLMNEFEENTHKTKIKPEKTIDENAGQLMNELCDQLAGEQFGINPKQFDELFEQITYIIKQDQKQKGVGLYEINQFVDNCFSVKDTLVEGLQQINIDQDDPLVQQTQQFLEDLIKNNVVQQQKRQHQFPTLGSIDSKNKNGNKNKNYVQIIQEGYKEEKSKQNFFTPSKVPTVMHSQNMHGNSIYSISSDSKSYADIMQLSKEYNGMGVDSLKFIYHHLHDINRCKTFLEKYYPDKKYVIKITEKKKVEPPKMSKNTHTNIQEAIELRKKSVDVDLRHLSLGQIRSELDHLFKIKNLFKLTKNKTTNIAYRKQLERLAGREDNRIQKLGDAAREKLMEEMAESHPQYVDLHGYREEQIDNTFNSIRDMILVEFKRGNSKLKTQKYGSQVYIIVKGLTGKGRHSRYGKSILKPALKQWADYYDYKAIETEDSIDVYIKVL